MIRQMTTALLALAASASQAQQVHENLAYGPGERNMLDLFIPDTVETPPLVLYIHGGAWFRGDKDQVEDYDRRTRMNAAGIAVATMNYTWSQQAVWPAQRNDVEAAIRFLQDKAENYGYDMSRFAVWGQSSGADLALWAGVLDARDPSLGVDAVVSWYAPSDLYQLWQDRLDDDVPGGNEREPDPTPESQLLGADARENKALADAASPDVQTRDLPAEAALPPTLLVHGTMDVRVSPLQSQRVLDILKARGADADLILVEGGGHGGDGFDAIVAPSIAHIQKHVSAD
jgi:acetyl esterase/lipase